MNRVYKVIWSKAKHCYVVTSEIARSVTKSASSARSAGSKGAAVLAMAALLFTAGGVLGEAANVTDIIVNDKGNVITVTKDVGDPKTITIDNVASAVKATQDGVGNSIVETYATKEDVKTYYVQKAEAQVTNLYASGDVKAGSTLDVGDGKFIVDIAGMTTTGDLTVKGDTEMRGDLGVNGNIKTNRGFIQTGGGNINTQGGALRTNGGNINAGDGLIKTTGTVKAGDVQTGILTTTGKATIGGALTVTGNTEMKGNLGVTDNLSVGGEFNSGTLSSKLDKDNYTTINGGKMVSMNQKNDVKTGETQASASTFDENGSNAWAKDDDSIGKSSMTADKISQSLSDTGDYPSNAASRVLSQIADNKYEIADSVVDANGNTNTSTQLSDRTITNIKNGTNESIDLQQADQIGSSVTDGTNTSVVSQNAGSLIFSITDGPNNTGVTQTATDITNTAKNGTIANEAKDITNHATGNMTNTVGGNLTTTVGGNETRTVEGTLKETVTGDVTEDYKANLNTTVVGNETRTVEGTLTETVTGDVTEDYKANLDTTVTGDSSLSAENINNKATKALTNEAETITNKAHESVTTQIGEGTAVKSVMDVKGIANTATGRAITNDAATITNTGIASVTNQVGDNKVLVETNQVKSAFGDTIYTTWDADGITNDAADKAVKTFTGNNTVISDNDGTTFENTAHSTAFKGGTVTKTTISGNTITTGKAVMDYANVTKDLSVGGDLNVDGNIETHDAVLSADSRQVVTGRQLYQTNERVDRLDNRIKKVGANAAALAALRPGDFNPDDKFSIAAGFGSYRNANAAALGLFYRPNENVLLSLGTSFGDGENMVNAGVSVKFGRGKSMAERRKEMADEVSSMRDEMRSQDERIAELEEMLKKQSELIEKLSKES